MWSPTALSHVQQKSSPGTEHTLQIQLRAQVQEKLCGDPLSELAGSVAEQNTNAA